MFKRALLAFTFVFAIGAAGLGIGSKAMAWSDWHSNVVAYPDPYAYPTYAGYAGYYSYAPRVAYYPTHPVRSYPVFYGRDYDRHHHHHKHHKHHKHHSHHKHHQHRSNGLTISFGF